MKRIYIACPYSHPDATVREARFELVNEVSAWFVSNKFSVFSPISMSHPIAKYMDNHNDSDFWVNLDLDWLKECDIMVIVQAPGWAMSRGIRREIDYALKLGIKIRNLDPDTMEVDGGL